MRYMIDKRLIVNYIYIYIYIYIHIFIANERQLVVDIYDHSDINILLLV